MDLNCVLHPVSQYGFYQGKLIRGAQLIHIRKGKEKEKEKILKGTPSKDVSWPENTENEQIFPFAGFVQLFYQYLSNRSTSLL